MTIPIPARHGRVVWRVAAVTSDGDDADLLPDYLPPTGTVTFTPTPTDLKIKNALPKPLTVLPAPITCGIDSDGDLCYPLPGEGVVTNKFVNLVATDDPEINPVGFTYTVTFKLFYAGAVLPLAPFSIDVPLDTEVDLTLVAPVSKSNGTQIIRGQDGQDNTLVIGTVTTGEVAGATITGTFPVQTLDLVLPSGGGGGEAAQDTGWLMRNSGYSLYDFYYSNDGIYFRRIGDRVYCSILGAKVPLGLSGPQSYIDAWGWNGGYGFSPSGKWGTVTTVVAKDAIVPTSGTMLCSLQMMGGQTKIRISDVNSDGVDKTLTNGTNIHFSYFTADMFPDASTMSSTGDPAVLPGAYT